MSEEVQRLSIVSTQRWFADAYAMYATNKPHIEPISSVVWAENSTWPNEAKCDQRIVVLDPQHRLTELCIKAIKAAPNPLPTLVFVTAHDVLFMKLVLRDIALGYLTPDQGFGDLDAALAHVAKGDTYVPQCYVKDLMAEPPTKTPKLSNREKLIAKLLVSGESHQAIGEQLHISVKTVSSHKTNIIERLGFQSLPDLVRFHDKYPFAFKPSPKKKKKNP